MGLTGVYRRRNRGVTRRDPRRPVDPDRLHRQFVPDAPNRVWVADLTQHRTEEGGLYLATVVDAFSRAVVGWAMGDRPVAEGVVDAVRVRGALDPGAKGSATGRGRRVSLNLSTKPGHL